MTPEQLQTPERKIYRIRLQPLMERDLNFVRTLRNQFREFFVNQEEITPEQQQQWYENVYLQRKREDYTLFVIRTLTNEEAIGTTSFSKLTEGMYEIGNNILKPDCQGKGYFTEVYHLMKETLGNAAIVATVLKSNKHMIDVYKRLGFTSRDDETNKHLTEKGDIVTLTDK